MTRAAWILLCLAATAGAEGGVRWGDSFEEAQKASAASGKPLLALFWAEW